MNTCAAQSTNNSNLIPIQALYRLGSLLGKAMTERNPRKRAKLIEMIRYLPLEESMEMAA